MTNIIPQNIEGSEDLEPCLVSVDDIERLTGLNFNPVLDPAIADSLESMKLFQLWEN